EVIVKLRLSTNATKLDKDFDAIFAQRIREADEFYDHRLPATLTKEERSVARQAYAGLLWSKEFYHYIVRDWLDGDPSATPPPDAWACWRAYKITAPHGQRDRVFLSRTFQKLLLNFTWWVNRKDAEGKNLFSGGFLGLDNIGVFDRSKPLPTGGHLEQADGTAWMAFYCSTMFAMAVELAVEDPAYEDVASKFLEHFVAIADAMNRFSGSGLWDEEDGFYYD